MRLDLQRRANAHLRWATIALLLCDLLDGPGIDSALAFAQRHLNVAQRIADELSALPA